MPNWLKLLCKKCKIKDLRKIHQRNQKNNSLHCKSKLVRWESTTTLPKAIGSLTQDPLLQFAPAKHWDEEVQAPSVGTAWNIKHAITAAVELPDRHCWCNCHSNNRYFPNKNVRWDIAIQISRGNKSLTQIPSLQSEKQQSELESQYCPLGMHCNVNTTTKWLTQNPLLQLAPTAHWGVEVQASPLGMAWEINTLQQVESPDILHLNRNHCSNRCHHCKHIQWLGTKSIKWAHHYNTYAFSIETIGKTTIRSRTASLSIWLALKYY